MPSARAPSDLPGHVTAGHYDGSLGTLLAGLGRTGKVFDAQLAVQELVTNALRYAPPHELRIFITPLDVEIAVVDGGADHRSVAELLTGVPDETPSVDDSGRGLRIVSALFPGACGAAPAPAAPGIPGGKTGVDHRSPPEIAMR